MPESGEGSPDQLARLRAELDAVDSRLIEAAAERQRLVSKIGRVKQGSGRQVRDFVREREVLDGVRSRAEALGLDGDVAADLLARLIRASLTRQEHERARLVDHGGGRRALIIGGAGLMGGWMASFLDNQGFDVLLADPALVGDGERFFEDWRSAPSAVDVVVLATPIALSASILGELARRGSPALVFDIASIKTPLIEPLEAAARSGLRVCSLHPMFGPETRLLSGRHVLVMSVGNDEADAQAEALFSETMAEVMWIGLAEHDRLVALILGLSHAVNIAFASALADSGLAAEELAGLSSTSFDRQLGVARDVVGENPALYFEIQQLNEHGVVARRALAEAVERLDRCVCDDDPEAFAELMRQGRDWMAALA